MGRLKDWIIEYEDYHFALHGEMPSGEQIKQALSHYGVSERIASDHEEVSGDCTMCPSKRVCGGGNG